MGGLYTPYKDFKSGAILTEGDLDGLQAYLITQHAPLMIDDYSTTVAEMQTMVDPGEVGSESQAGSLAGEIARLRKLISEITGKSQWYESPSGSLVKSGHVLSRQTSAGTGTDANTSEKVLFTYTLPANTVIAHPQAVSVIAAGGIAANTNNKTIRLRIGGISGPSMLTFGPLPLNGAGFGSGFLVSSLMIYSTVAIAFGPATFLHNDVSGSFFQSSQVAAWNTAQDLVVTGQNGTASANDIVCRYFEVRFVGAP